MRIARVLIALLWFQFLPVVSGGQDIRIQDQGFSLSDGLDNRGGKKTSDARMHALGVAATGMAAYETYGKASQLIADPSSATSVGISLSLGKSSSRSTSEYQVNSAVGSLVKADGNVSITATDGDLRVRGSEVEAAKDVRLAATKGNIVLEAAENRFAEQNSHSSSSGSIGVSVGAGGWNVNVSGNKAKGSGNGETLSHTNTHVKAGGTASVQSGGDTTLRGATIVADTVKADIGGNLNIESLQDKSTYSESSRSSGFGISIPVTGGGKPGVSVSGGRTQIDSDYQSVVEQSGIRAGDGGFDVKVKGDTNLKGGAITSTQVAVDDGKNRFETGGTLTTSDIENRADYDASGYQVTLGVGGSRDSSSAGVGFDKGNAASTSKASISGIAGDSGARTGDKESGLKPIFDKEQVRNNVDAGIATTAEFGKQGTKAVSKYSDDRAAQLRREGKEDEAQKWDEGGEYRVAMHTMLGAIGGGAGGAAGAAVSAAGIPVIGEEIAKMNLPEQVREGLTQLAGMAAGAIAGGSAGAAASLNETAYNYLSHSPFREVRNAVNRENARLMNACGVDCTNDDLRFIDKKMAALESAGNLTQISKNSRLTTDQAVELGETVAMLLPFYGTPIAVYQAITGESLSGRDLGTAERFFSGLISIIPAGSATYKFVQEAARESKLIAANGGKTGTVFDFIKPTQDVYPGSVIPKSFEMVLPNGEKIWVAGNATEHMAEFAAMKAKNYTPEAVRLASQMQLRSLQAAADTATAKGVPYGELINIGGWELKFAPPRQPGQLPSLIHALSSK